MWRRLFFLDPKNYKYPWTNKYCEVPSGHPEILTSEALVDRSPAELFGMIKCDILPPS